MRNQRPPAWLTRKALSRPASRESSKWRWLQSFTLKHALVLVVVCSGAYLLIRGSAINGVLIEPISLPEPLLKAGFTPEGVAEELSEQIRFASTQSEFAHFLPFPLFRAADLPEIVGVETKTTLRAVANFTRTLVGSERTIRGEIRQGSSDSTLQVVLRITNKADHQIVRCELKCESFQHDLKECAYHDAIRALNPVLYLLNLYGEESAACETDQCTLPKTKAFAQDSCGSETLSRASGQGQF